MNDAPRVVRLKRIPLNNKGRWDEEVFPAEGIYSALSPALDEIVQELAKEYNLLDLEAFIHEVITSQFLDYGMFYNTYVDENGNAKVK